MTRPLGRFRSELMERVFPRIAVRNALLTRRNDINPAALFDAPCRHIWMEIGFGTGERLAEMIRRNPEDGFIGAEPFINGMAAFVDAVKDMPLERIRVLMDDALLLVNSLKPGSLDGIYILNPDPWPKKRHHKRRVVNHDNLDAFARVLRPGGSLTMTTDIDDLAEWMLTHAFNHPDFVWTASGPDDWRSPPPGWIVTKYEGRGRKAGRRQTYLNFIRR